MKLYTLGVDFPVKKVLACAALVGIKVEVILASTAELATHSTDAKSMCLVDDAGVKTSNNIPILKFLAMSANRADMVGGENSASVDEWLDFSWSQLGTLMNIVTCHVYMFCGVWCVLFYHILPICSHVPHIPHIPHVPNLTLVDPPSSPLTEQKCHFKHSLQKLQVKMLFYKYKLSGMVKL